MLKLIQQNLVIIIFISLVGCSSQSETLDKEYADPEVPCLMVISGSDKVQAVRGTTSWDSFEADSVAPPELVAYQEGKINAKLNSEIEMNFSEKPKSFEVYLWNDEEREKRISFQESIFVADKSGSVVYEIKAEWAEGYAYFAFNINVD